VLLTRAPLYRGRSPFSLDLHVLGAPLTFVLSQDQTLQLNLLEVNSVGYNRGDGSCLIGHDVLSHRRGFHQPMRRPRHCTFLRTIQFSRTEPSSSIQESSSIDAFPRHPRSHSLARLRILGFRRGLRLSALLFSRRGRRFIAASFEMSTACCLRLRGPTSSSVVALYALAASPEAGTFRRPASLGDATVSRSPRLRCQLLVRGFRVACSCSLSAFERTYFILRCRVLRARSISRGWHLSAPCISRRCNPFRLPRSRCQLFGYPRTHV
jgi:hypothetical protein